VDVTSRVLVAAASGLLGLLLAGCGTGQDAPTRSTLPSVPGASAEVDGIAVRNARVPFAPAGYPAGAGAPIDLTILNTGTDPVQLVDLSSPAATSLTVASTAYLGTSPDRPGGPPNGGTGPELLLAPGDLVTVRLEATGLTAALGPLGVLPVRFVFDNGAELSLEVPTAPPTEPLPRPTLDLTAEEEGH
jgi:hypothetical protein